MEGFRQDLVLALRRLGRRPGIAILGVATLAVGIGGATAIFSVADAVVLRPMPFADPGRLVVMWQSDRPRSQPFVEMSYPTFRDWRAHNFVFEDLAGMPSTNQSWVLTGRGEPAKITGRIVTASFFPVLGVPPARGRALLPEDDRQGAARVVVLSHALWRDRFGAAADVIGQAAVLDGQPFTVVGVMPPGFAYPRGVELWTPVVPAVGALAERPEVWWMSAIGRLRRGVSLERARRDMNALVERYDREHFKAEGYAAVITPLDEALLGPTRPALLALLGAVGLVLLVACANVAGLQLVQMTERGSEMAVRLILGASHGRLARGLFAESFLLATAGGALGVLVSWAGIPLLLSLSPQEVPRLHDASLDARALGFAVAVSVAAAVLSGLAPALAVRHQSLPESLHDAARSVAGGRRRLRGALVVAEVALALVLLAGGGLLVRSFLALREAPLGFESSHVLSVAVGLPTARYPGIGRRRLFFEELLARVRALPGVASAAVVTLRPLSGTVGMDWPFVVEGQSDRDAERNPLLNFETVSTGYFETMGIPLRRGRSFTADDRDGRPGVVVVGESLARRYWPGQDPLGKRLRIPLPPTGYDNAWLTVVGVAGDARYRELRATRLDLYMSHLQSDHELQDMVVRTRALEPAALATAVREVVRQLDPQQPPPEVTTMDDVVSEALGGPRFAARVFGAFALVALFLAALGLYGLLAYSVGRRTREIGVRVSLGARPADVSRLVAGDGLRLVLLGIAIGLATALVGGRLVASLLFEVGPRDAFTLAGASATLLAVSLLASALPAWRAARVDAAVALRHE
jgi:predicted permease